MSSLTFPLTFPLTAGDHPTASLTSWLQLQRYYFSFLPNPSFTNPLQTSLVPLWNNGSGTPTFTRASTAYQTDFSATLNAVLSGEARFQGARRVANLYASSAAFATTTNTTIAGAYTVSFTGTGTITFSGTNVGSLVGQGASTRVAATITTTAGTLTSTVTGTVTNAQLENVTGKANQNPSEYVDSATAYGVGVNAVQYFNYLNGNTVASNVVTQAQGAAIVAGQAGVAATAPVDSKGPYGYLSEGARADVLGTTTAIRRNMTDVGWVAVTTTVATTVGIDGGAATGARLTAGGANSTILFTPGLGAGVRTYSVWIKRITGTGTIQMTADVADGYVTQTITAAYAQYQVTSSSAVPVVGFKIVTSGDVIDVDFNTLEAATFANPTPIPVNVSKAADVLTYPSAGNISGTVGTAYAEFTAAQTGTGIERAVLSNGTPDNIYIETLTGAGTPLGLNDGTTNRSFGLNTNVPITSPVKAATVWSGSATNGFLSGAAGTPAGFDGDMNIGATTIVGNCASGNRPLYGTIRGVKIYPVALSAGKLTALTTP